MEKKLKFTLISIPFILNINEGYFPNCLTDDIKNIKHLDSIFDCFENDFIENFEKLNETK